MSRIFDVDIDVQSGIERTAYGTRAMVYNAEAGKVLPHPSGVYIQKVPVDHLTGNAAIDYKDGDALDLLKVDILTNTSYDIFKNKDDLLAALEEEPDWGLLRRRDIVSKLPHISTHYDLIQDIEPTSIIELADCLALIRPGKAHLVDEYRADREGVRRILYKRPRSGVYFKKSHAVSYAVMIAAILCRLQQQVVSW